MTQKIRLRLDALQVESFETDAIAGETGTVRAYASGQSCPHACTLDEPTCKGPLCNTVPVLTCLC